MNSLEEPQWKTFLERSCLASDKILRKEYVQGDKILKCFIKKQCVKWTISEKEKMRQETKSWDEFPKHTHTYTHAQFTKSQSSEKQPDCLVTEFRVTTNVSSDKNPETSDKSSENA